MSIAILHAYETDANGFLTMFYIINNIVSIGSNQIMVLNCRSSHINVLS